MSRYSLSQNLPSCSVSVKLLGDLERYITEKVGPSDTKGLVRLDAYHFSIQDSMGTEKFERVNDFKYHVLPDDTKAAELSVRGESLGVRLRFHVSGLLSSMEVDYEGSHAKEMVKGVLSGIQDRIKAYRTPNHLLAPASWLHWIVICVGFGIFQFINVKGYDPIQRIGLRTLLLVVWTFVCFYAIAGLAKLRPYTTFDTVLNRRKERWFVWVMSGVVVALVISVVGSLLGNYLWQQSHTPGK